MFYFDYYIYIYYLSDHQYYSRSPFKIIHSRKDNGVTCNFLYQTILSPGPRTSADKSNTRGTDTGRYKSKIIAIMTSTGYLNWQSLKDGTPL